MWNPHCGYVYWNSRLAWKTCRGDGVLEELAGVEDLLRALVPVLLVVLGIPVTRVVALEAVAAREAELAAAEPPAGARPDGTDVEPRARGQNPRLQGPVVLAVVVVAAVGLGVAEAKRANIDSQAGADVATSGAEGWSGLHVVPALVSTVHSQEVLNLVRMERRALVPRTNGATMHLQVPV